MMKKLKMSSYNEQVNDDEDEEMTDAEVDKSRNDDEENTVAEKTDVEKTKEVKDDAKKAELSPTNSSLSSLFVLTIPVLVISEPLILTSTPKTPSVAHVTTLLPPSSISAIPPIPHQTTSPIPTPPITTDAPTITTVVPKSNALTNV
uniref:Uncharacterized protein n=1 Tax=Tanacetum cinerariifolium TaxID=118510 RepID=A0A699JFD9_TANCI|nr:hypothetical protein [Tanacetum cinerariifolium]